MPPEPTAGGAIPPAERAGRGIVIVVDAEGRIAHLTRRAARLLGHEPGRLLGVPLDVLLTPHSRDERARAASSRAPSAEGPAGRWRPGTEVLARGPDGRVVALRLERSSIEGTDGSALTSLVLAEVPSIQTGEGRTAALAELASRVSAAPRPEEIADIVVEHAQTTLGASVVELILLEGDGAQLLRLVGYDAETVAQLDARTLLDEGAIGEAIRSRRTITIRSGDDRHARYPGIGRWLGAARPRSIVCLPLVVDRLVLGGLALGFDHDRDFSPDDLSHVEVVAHVVAQGLHRGRLFDDARIAAANAMALARLTSALARAATSRDAAGALLDELQEAVRPASAAVALLDEAAQEFELIELRSGERTITAQERWPIDLPSPARDVVRGGRAILLDEAEYHARYAKVSSISDPKGMGRYIALPLVVAGGPIGAVGLSFPVHRTGDLPVTHLQALVDAAAQAIARARSADSERAARHLLAAVVGQMPLGVLVVGARSLEVLYANGAYHSLFGHPERGDAEPAVLRLDGSPWPVDERPYLRALVRGEIVTDELCLLERPDGSRATVAINAGPVRDAEGTIMAAVAVYSDVTSRREAELARDAFIGILSHELRTPITSIFAGAVLLQRGVEPETARDVAAGVMDDAERLRAIVEDLLVLSRVEHGADFTRDDAVLVHRVVARVVSEERRRWPGRRFELSVPPDVPPVLGDEGYIEHIVRNLLSNAGKYGPPDGRIEVVVEPDGEWVRVRVLDEGPGIQPGDEERVFGLFYRSDQTARQAPGAGIGLYAVRALVDGMGGRVWARSRSSGGAEVGFALPTLPPDRLR